MTHSTLDAVATAQDALEAQKRAVRTQVRQCQVSDKVHEVRALLDRQAQAGTVAPAALVPTDRDRRAASFFSGSTTYSLGDELTRAEEGCISFEVTQDTVNPLICHVNELFNSHASFDAYQLRTLASEWGAQTAHIKREYIVSEVTAQEDVREHGRGEEREVGEGGALTNSIDRKIKDCGGDSSTELPPPQSQSGTH